MSLFAKPRRSSSSKINVDSVSDAEALLACRAYLQRRNQLGLWKTKERRRRGQPSRMNTTTTISDSDTGFFWPDPTQLKYLYRSDINSSNLEDDFFDEGNSDGDEEEFNEWDSADEDQYIRRKSTSADGEVSAVPDMIRADDIEHENNMNELDHTMTIDDDFQTHRRRSMAARRTWSDPKFRSRWYENRWGEHRRQRRPLQQKALESRLRALDPDEFLESAALASMTEEEIAKAIRTYVSSNRKRSVSRQKSLQARKALLTETGSKRLPRDFLLNQDPIQLEKAQRRRAERAANAYKTRLANGKKRPPSTDLGADRMIGDEGISVSEQTPSHALDRIKTRLSLGERPVADDVKLILEPVRLAKRKKVLLDILKVCFDMRGKCVPPLDTLGNWEGDKEFVIPSCDEIQCEFCTQVPVGHLGQFVLYCLHRSEHDTVT